MRRLAIPLFVFALLAPAFAGLHAASPPDPATLAAGIDRLLAAAVGPHSASFLADYANQTGNDPARFEPTTDAARRLLAGGPAERQPPDITALHLDRLAAAVLAAPDATPDHRLAAHRARFHARRLLAAVHYNLFKRGLRLAELLAATYREKDAVAAWRDLVAVAVAARHPAAPQFHADLKRFDASYRELEEQCCPPDDALLKEPVWQPARSLP